MKSSKSVSNVTVNMILEDKDGEDYRVDDFSDVAS